jgi:hypothetical protein
MIRVNNKDNSTITPGRGQKLDEQLFNLPIGTKLSIRQLSTGHVQILEVKGKSEYQLYVKFDDYKTQSQWMKGDIDIEVL